MHPRRATIRLVLATSVLLLTVAVASLWIGFGFSDRALITCGVIYVHADTFTPNRWS